MMWAKPGCPLEAAGNLGSAGPLSGAWISGTTSPADPGGVGGGTSWVPAGECRNNQRLSWPS